ncbi:uncharacterized protein LOC141535972 [Cotesia typhae]|uniref:uncharacterized protein LOC141535972 n=1 Tax=Cotesia typhae TaxID=2053667 RepID=UPI003D68B32B
MKKLIQFYDIKPKLYFMFVTHKDNCLLDGTLFTYTFDRHPLNSFIFCYSAFDDLLIFTYNLYINLTHKHSDFKSFGEFYYAYYNKDKLCRDLNLYDTAEIRGYSIAVGFDLKDGKFLSEDSILSYKNYTDYVDGYDGEFIGAILQALNVKIKYTKLQRGDVIFQNLFRSGRYGGGYFLSVFTSFAPVHLIFHDPGQLTPLEKICNYYGVTTGVSLIIILSVVFIAVFFWGKTTLSFAFFEIFLLLINTEIKIPMKRSSKRVFFSVIFLYFLIIHATFVGYLAEFLTKKENRPSVETVEDLQDSQYKAVHGSHVIERYFWDISSLDNINVTFSYPDIEDSKCRDLIKNDTSVVCADDPKVLLDEIISFNLLYSKRPFIHQYRYLAYTENFPLLSQFDSVVLRLLETGLSEKWREDSIANNVYKLKVLDARSSIYYRPIVIEDLYFIFIVLFTGYVCAIISFAVEKPSKIQLIFRNKVRKFHEKRQCRKLYRALRRIAEIGFMFIQHRGINKRLRI